MSLFPVLSIAGSGIEAMQTWINTSAGNVANMDDTVPTSGTAYQAQTPVLAASGGGLNGDGQGVTVTGISLGPAGLVAHEPDSPQADAGGNVQVPNITLSDQLVGMMEAQDGYQADANVINQARTAYQSGLTIGS